MWLENYVMFLGVIGSVGGVLLIAEGIIRAINFIKERMNTRVRK